MAKLKTRPSEVDPRAFVEAVEHPKRREDGLVLLDLMQEITGEKPQMWGPSIIGFGSYHYVYDSGREGDWMLTGFSPRKSAMTLYIMGGYKEHESLMKKLGKHKTGKSCLYINKLEDVDMAVLKRLIKQSTAYIQKKYAPAP